MHPALPLPLPLFAAAAVTLAVPSPAVDDRKAACRDTIEMVREAVGQPRLERVPASEADPLLIAAVDRRIDRCRVLVMARDTRDMRPEPAPATGRATLRPAHRWRRLAKASARP